MSHSIGMFGLFSLVFLAMTPSLASTSHDVPGGIKAWEYDSSDDSVYVAKRGSSYEVRFKEGQTIFYAIKNNSGFNTFKLYLTYSSKNTDPDLAVSVDGKSFDVEPLPSTGAHSSFNEKLAVASLQVPNGGSKIKIKSRNANFYLRKLDLQIKEDEDPIEVPPAVVHEIPGDVMSTDYLSSSVEPVTVAPRGAGYEVRLEQGQEIQYKVKVQESGDYVFSFYYSSAGTVPKLDLSIDGQSVKEFSLDKTSGHGNYKVDEVPGVFSLVKGEYTLKVKTHHPNFYFRKVMADVSVAKVFSSIYQINVGSVGGDGWFGDKKVLNEVTPYLDGTNRSVFFFGSPRNKAVDARSKTIAIHSSVPDDVSTHVFDTYRQESLTDEHHAPGVHYELALNPGDYRLRFLFVLKGDQAKVRLQSSASLSLDEIELPSSNDYLGYAVEVDARMDSGHRFDLDLISQTYDDQFNLAGIQVLSEDQSEVIELPSRPVVYVSPNGSGDKSGVSPSQARAFSSLNAAIGSLSSTGGDVLLLSDQGQYTITESMNISKGGDSASKVVVIKTYRSSESSEKAKFVGTRVSPWVDKSSSKGKEFLRLISGADHLRFEDLQFENFGNGIFRIAKPVSNITLAKIRAVNFERLIENNLTGSGSGASVDGLYLEDIEGQGYGRGLVRLTYASHKVRLERIFSDSEEQLSSDFPMGVALQSEVYDVEIKKALFTNHREVLSSGYFNGDGVATESEVSDVLIEDVISTQNTDGGFDLKSTSTVLKRTIAYGNKRNYRLWNPVEIVDSYSFDPIKWGGSGNKVHFGLFGNRDFNVTIRDTTIIDVDSNSTIFYSGESGSATFYIDGGSVESQGSSVLYDLESRTTISDSTQLILP